MRDNQEMQTGLQPDRRKRKKRAVNPGKSGAPEADIVSLQASLLDWYRANRRDLPWRHTRDPYAIWISEIMLQQTRVAAVRHRYELFLLNFPTVQALAEASESEVLTLWSGLGYYRRARMLHRGAKAVVESWSGAMPRNSSSLRQLPGIGAYTSAAIASIAYGEPIAVVDGNVERVIQRLAGWGSEETAGKAKLAREINAHANLLLDPKQAGDFNQSMMELGATICLPRNPQCLVCPIRAVCKTRGEHPTPVRARMRKEDLAYALVLRPANPKSHQLPQVLLVRRSQQETVMPGMWELPSLRDADVADTQVRLTVRHAIMQVNYRVSIRTIREEDLEIVRNGVMDPSQQTRWYQISELDTLPLTGLARKVLLKSKLPELVAAS